MDITILKIIRAKDFIAVRNCGSGVDKGRTDIFFRTWT